jgi:hypothetical protein
MLSTLVVCRDSKTRLWTLGNPLGEDKNKEKELFQTKRWLKKLDYYNSIEEKTNAQVCGSCPFLFKNNSNGSFFLLIKSAFEIPDSDSEDNSIAKQLPWEIHSDLSSIVHVNYPETPYWRHSEDEDDEDIGYSGYKLDWKFVDLEFCQLNFHKDEVVLDVLPSGENKEWYILTQHKEQSFTYLVYFTSSQGYKQRYILVKKELNPVLLVRFLTYNRFGSACYYPQSHILAVSSDKDKIYQRKLHLENTTKRDSDSVFVDLGELYKGENPWELLQENDISLRNALGLGQIPCSPFISQEDIQNKGDISILNTFPAIKIDSSSFFQYSDGDDEDLHYQIWGGYSSEQNSLVFGIIAKERNRNVKYDIPFFVNDPFFTRTACLESGDGGQTLEYPCVVFKLPVPIRQIYHHRKLYGIYDDNSDSEVDSEDRVFDIYGRCADDDNAVYLTVEAENGVIVHGRLTAWCKPNGDDQEECSVSEEEEEEQEHSVSEEEEDLLSIKKATIILDVHFQSFLLMKRSLKIEDSSPPFKFARQ